MSNIFKSEKVQKSLFFRNKDILILALPIFFELILGLIIGYVDSFQMSYDQDAVSAILQTNQITMVVNVSFQVLTTASVILISQLNGKKDLEASKKVYAISFYTCLLISFIFSAILFFCAEPLYTAIGVRDLDNGEVVMEKAIAYMQYTGSWVFLQGLITTFSAFLRANKKMVMPTAVSLIMNILNVGGNAIGIYLITHQETTGTAGIISVALSSSISRIVGLIIIVIMYIKYVHVSLSLFNVFKKGNLKFFSKILSVGLPSAGETLSYNVAQLVILIIINKTFFDNQISGNIRGYFSSVTSVIYLFAAGLSQAMQIVEGNLIGANEKDKAEILMKDSVKMACIVSFIMSVIMLAISYPLFSYLLRENINAGDTATIYKTQLAIPVCCLIMMSINIVLEQGRARNLILVKGLQTTGDIFVPVLSAIVSCWLFAVFGTYLFGSVLKLGVIGVVIANTLDENFRGIIFQIRLKSGVWKKKDLTKNLSNKNMVPLEEVEPLNNQ